MTLPAERSTIVLGAGVAGLSVALYLQRSGHAVTVIDPLPPGTGSSYGNSGLISADTAVPIAMPGMLQKVPRWLSDPLGPLAVRPAYFPRALPWLMRWIGASREPRVLAISGAMRAMHAGAFDCWRELLGDALYAEFIRRDGQVKIWEGEGVESALELEICRRHDIPIRMLGQGELQDLYPGLAPDIRRGMLMPGNGCTVNPRRLVATLADLLQQAGGQLVHEQALRIVPRGGAAGQMVFTNISNRVARNVVVATGAWSRALLDPLGIAVPLESERGYHAMLPDPSLTLAMPISTKTRGFGLSSMEEGLRVAGTVEIGGLDAPPTLRRAEILVEHARRLFPALRFGEPKYWLGHRPSTPDSLPVVGAVPGHDGLWLALGHGHFGLTGGPPSARLLSQLIDRRAPGIDPAPYSVTRFGSRLDPAPAMAPVPGVAAGDPDGQGAVVQNRAAGS